jgi:UDP-N-acetylglucosamine:LPS N-acetylglucosamine transferase
MFNEALAVGLPIVALEPPPGSERVQYRLLEEWRVGRAVRTLDEAVGEVARLLSHTDELDAMRLRARSHSKTDAASRIARRLDEELSARRLEGSLDAATFESHV